MSGTITVTRTEIRSNTEIQFFVMSPAELEYRNQNFVKNGKILFSKTEISDDKLTRKFTVIFLDEQSRLDYRNDSVISDFRSRKKQYNKSNNITSDVKFLVDQ